MWATFSVILPVACIFAATQNEASEKLWLSLAAFMPLLSLLILSTLPQKNPDGTNHINENRSSERKLEKKESLTRSVDLETSDMDASVAEKDHLTTKSKGTEAMPSHSEAARILQNESWAEILDAICLHFNELIENHGHHEDYERDACREMVGTGSPFSKWFKAAYEDQTGEKYSKGEEITFDDLRGFAFSQNDEFIFNFLMNYLSAMRRDGSKLPGISKTESKKWKPMVEASLTQTINALSAA
jgi:hypothetical protein